MLMPSCVQAITDTTEFQAFKMFIWILQVEQNHMTQVTAQAGLECIQDMFWDAAMAITWCP